jgi:hypothetical protein
VVIQTAALDGRGYARAGEMVKVLGAGTWEHGVPRPLLEGAGYFPRCLHL